MKNGYFSFLLYDCLQWLLMTVSLKLHDKIVKYTLHLKFLAQCLAYLFLSVKINDAYKINKRLALPGASATEAALTVRLQDGRKTSYLRKKVQVQAISLNRGVCAATNFHRFTQSLKGAVMSIRI